MKNAPLLSLQYWVCHPYFYDNISQTLEFSSFFSCNELTLVSKQNKLKTNNIKSFSIVGHYDIFQKA